MKNYELTEPMDSDQILQLDLLAEKLQRKTYPGYPVFNHRYFGAGESPYDSYDDGCLILPDGPWTINSHPNRQDHDIIPSSSELNRLMMLGLRFDSFNRPLHPWLDHMLANPDTGIVTGKGAYWNWGPNYTSDAIVIRGDEVLLIKRGDTGEWALPGGFVDPGEDDLNTALREVWEESGVRIPANSYCSLVHRGLVIDIRVTANAWPETSAHLLIVDPREDMGEPEGNDDADEAKWTPIEEALSGTVLFGSHRFLLLKALTSSALGRWDNRPSGYNAPNNRGGILGSEVFPLPAESR